MTIENVSDQRAATINEVHTDRLGPRQSQPTAATSILPASPLRSREEGTLSTAVSIYH